MQMRETLWWLYLRCSVLTCVLSGGSLLQAQQPTPFPREDSLHVYRTPTVVVTGSRNPVTVEYAPVRVEVLQLTPTTIAGQLTAAELLETSAGIVQQYRLRSGIQMMGLDPAYTLILLNGQPLTGRVAGVIDLQRLPLGDIERIEIVKGPMSSLYGSTALGGVVNLLTVRPQRGWTGSFQSQYLSRQGSELHGRIGYGTSSVAFQLYGFLRRSSPFELVADTTLFPYPGRTEFALGSSAYWHPAAHWRLEADGRLFQSRTHGAFAESYGNQLAVNHGVFRQREWSTSLTASWTRGRARFQLGLFGNQYGELYNWDVPPTPTASSNDDFRQRLARLWSQYDVLWSERYRLALGGELLYEDIAGTRYPDRPTTRTAAAFLQWEGIPYTWFSYALSLRWDRPSAYGEHWSPKIAFLVRPLGHSGFQVRVSAGSGFRAPDFRQLFVTFTNRLEGAGYALIGARRRGYELQPERSLAVDASAQLTLEQWLPWISECIVEARLFANWVRNLIEPFYVGRTEGLDIYSYRNLARIATRGLEMSLQGQLHPHPYWRMDLHAAWQLLDAVDLDVLDAIAAGRAGTQDPSTGRFTPLQRRDYGGLWGRSRHTFSGTLQLHFAPSKTTLTLRSFYRSRFGEEALDRNGIAVLNPPRRILDRDDEYVPGFWELSAWLTQFWFFDAVTLSVSLGGRNLTDVLLPRFLPHLFGRQWFVRAELRWNSSARSPTAVPAP